MLAEKFKTFLESLVKIFDHVPQLISILRLMVIYLSLAISYLQISDTLYQFLHQSGHILIGKRKSNTSTCTCTDALLPPPPPFYKPVFRSVNWKYCDVIIRMTLRL